MGFTIKQKRKILERQGYWCGWRKCGFKVTLSAMRLRDWNKALGHYPEPREVSAVQAKFHHIIPRSKGGPDAVTNGVALCGRHHSWRGVHPELRGKYQ